MRLTAFAVSVVICLSMALTEAWLLVALVAPTGDAIQRPVFWRTADEMND
ncbi:MAG: hypothetical protein ACR652_23310 [Methylocystis sp.]